MLFMYILYITIINSFFFLLFDYYYLFFFLRISKNFSCFLHLILYNFSFNSINIFDLTLGLFLIFRIIDCLV